jgi:hypothetical protein
MITSENPSDPPADIKLVADMNGKGDHASGDEGEGRRSGLKVTT